MPTTPMLKEVYLSYSEHENNLTKPKIDLRILK